MDIGNSVSKGQLLAALDQRDLAIRVREAEAQLSQARAAMRNADSKNELRLRIKLESKRAATDLMDDESVRKMTMLEDEEEIAARRAPPRS